MLIILTGVSCTGKSTIMTYLRDNYACNILTTYMTRIRRENEIEKITITKEKFHEMNNLGEFLFVNDVFDNLYGTPKKESFHASNSNDIWLIDFPINLVNEAFSSLKYKSLALMPESESQLKLQIKLGNRLERQELILSDYILNYSCDLNDKVDAVVVNKFNSIENTAKEVYSIFNKWRSN